MIKVLSFDIGGTNLRGALVDENYNVIKVNKVRTKHEGTKVFIQQINDMIIELMEGHDDIKHVVFGVPGRVRKSDFYIDELPNIGVKDIDLVTDIGNLFPELKVYVYNDAEIAGLYEANNGSGKNAKRVYYITISTGLGGCLFVDKLWTQSSYEIGHTLYEYKGNRYELEHIASGTGLRLLSTLNDLEIKSSKEFFQGVRLQNPKYINVFEEWLTIMGRFFRDLDRLYAPDVIVIGGGVAFQSEMFLKALQIRNKYVKIKISSQIDDSGLLGCVSLINLINKGLNPFE